jgi:hypothetical protein
MSGHRHHHGDERHRVAVVRGEPLDIPFPRAAEPRRTSAAAAAAVEPLLAKPPAAVATALPPEVYLIGCVGDVAVRGQASAQTMGFKAWNLLRMAQLSLPVPAAFVIGTYYCADPAARASASGVDLLRAGLHALEHSTVQALGDARRPLLLSVRSGAPVSMPGMMDTLLNIGLCDATVAGLMRQTGNPRLVWDAYRRLVATYGEVVAGLPATSFDEAATALFAGRDERELDFADLRLLTQRFIEVFSQGVGQPFPQDPAQQLGGAIEAVFASWQSPKARRVPAPEPHRRCHRDGSDGAMHGVRQCGRPVGCRRWLHARPGERRAASRRCGSTSCSMRRVKTWCQGGAAPSDPSSRWSARLSWIASRWRAPVSSHEVARC